jgi:hypothetical protein
MEISLVNARDQIFGSTAWGSTASADLLRAMGIHVQPICMELGVAVAASTSDLHTKWATVGRLLRSKLHLPALEVAIANGERELETTRSPTPQLRQRMVVARLETTTTA